MKKLSFLQKKYDYFNALIKQRVNNMESGDFFDENQGFYGTLKPHKYDYFFIEFIAKNSKKCNLLDVGGGGGCFTKLCQENFEDTNLCIVDPSKSLLQKQDLKNIELVVGKLPNDINIEEKYDYIHIKEVLHHVTGSSPKKSKNLVALSLNNLKENNLNKNGFIFIHELFYESHLFPTFTRTLIFYLLKIQNQLHIKIPVKEFLMGLDVCFYTRDELESLFKEHGFQIVDFHEEYWANSKAKKLMLLKDWGRMCFVIQNINEELEKEDESCGSTC